MCVRRPAGRPRSWRSQPMTPPASAAAPRRNAGSSHSRHRRGRPRIAGIQRYTFSAPASRRNRRRPATMPAARAMKPGDAVKGRATAAILVGATLLGFSAIFVKWAVAGGATALTVGFYRMLVRAAGRVAARAPRGLARRGARARLGARPPASPSSSTSRCGTPPCTRRAPPTRRSSWAACRRSGSRCSRSSRSAGARRARLARASSSGLAGALVLALARGARGGERRRRGHRHRRQLLLRGLHARAQPRARDAERAAGAVLDEPRLPRLLRRRRRGRRRTRSRGYDARAWASLVGLGLVVQLVGVVAQQLGPRPRRARRGALACRCSRSRRSSSRPGCSPSRCAPSGLLGGGLLVGGIVLVSLGGRRRAERAHA